jgi:hypothetical protein
MRRSDELRMYPLPFPVQPVVVRQFWHERNHADPGVVWLRSSNSELFSSGSSAPPRASPLQLNPA